MKLTYEETLHKISEYLSNHEVPNRVPDVIQYTHFIKGVYIVQVVGYNVRFSPKFLAWLDENEMYNVFLASITENVYSIVVKKEIE